MFFLHLINLFGAKNYQKSNWTGLILNGTLFSIDSVYNIARVIKAMIFVSNDVACEIGIGTNIILLATLFERFIFTRIIIIFFISDF